MTTKPRPFCIDESSPEKIYYYNSKELQEYDPIFYHGCKTKPRHILNKKSIPAAEYLFANLKDGKWNRSSEDCKKAQLLISKSWIEANMTKMCEQRADEPQDQSSNSDYCGDAPPIFELEENEKFRDGDGNILEIETRGEKTRKKIFFNVKDVVTAFSMSTLDHVIKDERSKYEMNKHYVTFFIRGKRVENANDTIKKEKYLTYTGMLLLLFGSKSRHAVQFQEWAEDKLFTIQMGQKEDKIKLGTDLLNITTKTYKAVFNTYANKFPCIYLLELGSVANLRKTFNISGDIDENHQVYKYGFTEDLTRRIGEHETKYGKLENVSIKLATFHVIDTKYTNEAEGDIRELVNTFQKKLNVEGFNELIVLNAKELVFVKKQYSYIGTNYAGATAELQKQIVELKDKIKDLENEITNSKIRYESEIAKYESKLRIETLTHENALQKERFENQSLKEKLETCNLFTNYKEEIRRLQQK
jgi:hypothetical protein